MTEFLKQHIKKITAISDEEFDYIFSHFTTKKFKKHQFVIQEGQNFPGAAIPTPLSAAHFPTIDYRWSVVTGFTTIEI